MIKNKENYKGKLKVNEDGIRIDIYLQSNFNQFSRTKIKDFINSSNILVNDFSVRPSYKLKLNDIISYNFVYNDDIENIKPINIDLNIIYEDSYIIVIDKPSGLVVHPGNGTSDNTLANGLIYHFSNLSKVNKQRPGIVHRLDKETSGIIVIAKDDDTHRKLSSQFENRTIKKTYRAIVWGKIKKSGTINGYIDRDRKNRTTFILNDFEKGRYSESYFKRINYLNPMSYVEINPKTGRTHQIRVHLNSISNPILCDSAYSGGDDNIKSFHMKHNKILKQLIKSMDRVALHAYAIEFFHPNTNEIVKFESQIPEDFKKTLNILEKYQNDTQTN